MTGFLRFVGVVNAAIWFGAAIFFNIAVPVFFTEEVKQKLFPPPYNGVAAQLIISRFFILQHWCGAIALIHLLAEWLYLGRVLERLTLGILVTIFSLNLIGGFWLQPKLHELHKIKYLGTTPEQKEQAAQSFRAWHGVSQMANMFVAAGLLFYLWRVTSTSHTSRLPGFRKLTVGWK